MWQPPDGDAWREQLTRDEAALGYTPEQRAIWDANAKAMLDLADALLDFAAQCHRAADSVQDFQRFYEWALCNAHPMCG